MFARMPSQQAWNCAWLFCRERQLDDLLHAVRAEHTGNPGKQPGLAVFSAKLRAGRHNGLFVVQNDVRHARGGRRNAVFGAVFSGECDPSAADGFFLQRLAVKPEPFVRLCPDVQRHAAEADARPWGKLLISVFAEHVARDRLVVDASLPGQRAEKTRGVQSGAGAEYAPLWEAQAPEQAHALQYHRDW